MKKILVADDHEIVLKGMLDMLKGGGYDVIGVTTADQAMVVLENVSDISLVVCDLSLPTTEKGLQLIENVRKINGGMPIVVFTMHDELWNIRALTDVGADGIVLKGDNPKELFYAVNTVINGGKYFSEQFLRLRNEVMIFKGILSQKEITILREITLGHKNRDIADMFCVTEKTIEFYRGTILKKLGAKTIAEATRRAFEIGLLQ